MSEYSAFPIWVLGVLGIGAILVMFIVGVVAAVVLDWRRSHDRGVTAEPGPIVPGDRVRAVSTGRKPQAPATAPQRCPECGAELPGDSPEGLCPRCLLQCALSSPEPTP